MLNPLKKNNRKPYFNCNCSGDLLKFSKLDLNHISNTDFGKSLQFWLKVNKDPKLCLYDN